MQEEKVEPLFVSDLPTVEVSNPGKSLGNPPNLSIDMFLISLLPCIMGLALV